MSVSREHILERLRRVKGPDLESNIVELDLVSQGRPRFLFHHRAGKARRGTRTFAPSR